MLKLSDDIIKRLKMLSDETPESERQHDWPGLDYKNTVIEDTELEKQLFGFIEEASKVRGFGHLMYYYDQYIEETIKSGFQYMNLIIKKIYSKNDEPVSYYLILNRKNNRILKQTHVLDFNIDYSIEDNIDNNIGAKIDNLLEDGLLENLKELKQLIEDVHFAVPSEFENVKELKLLLKEIKL